MAARRNLMMYDEMTRQLGTPRPSGYLAAAFAVVVKAIAVSAWITASSLPVAAATAVPAPAPAAVPIRAPLPPPATPPMSAPAAAPPPILVTLLLVWLLPFARKPLVESIRVLPFTS